MMIFVSCKSMGNVPQFYLCTLMKLVTLRCIDLAWILSYEDIS